MRIALSNPDVNLAGGVERVVTEAANHLARSGHDVSVYGARVDRSVLDLGVRVRAVPVPAGMDARTGLGFRRRCARAIEQDGPDIHGAFSTLSPLGGVFWVPSVHRVGYDFLLSRRGLAGRLAMQLHPYHRVRLRLERSMFTPGGCAGILAQTEAVRADIRRSYLNVPEIDVLPLGYDDKTFDPGIRARLRVDARAHLGYGPEDHVLLFAANELERKGFEVLLDAASRLAHTKILGAGRQTPAASTLRRLGDRVHWAGHVSDMAMLHAAADVLVLPTLYEPWGLVIVEALGSGLPVVTSRLAGASVAVEEGRTGRLLDDPEDQAALAEAIHWSSSAQVASAEEIAASVQRYTWARVISRYEEALREASNAS